MVATKPSIPVPPEAEGEDDESGRRGLFGTILRALNWLVLLGVTLAGVVSVAVVDTSAQVLLLKVFIIVFLSLLPGWLYLQFLLIKGDGLYDEFVLNLYRLKIDNIRNLPMPPPASTYWDEWMRERQDRTRAAPSENIYLRKFESVYGRASVPDDRRRPNTDPPPADEVGRKRRQLRSDTFAPVVWATALFCAGWLAVLQPDAYRLFEVGKVSASGFAKVPVEALQFGFIGSYAFLLQTVVRRYFQSDLKTHFFVGAISRIVVVALIVVAVDQIWPSSAGALNAFAFFAGFFPLLGLQLIQQALTRLLGNIVPVIDERYPLSDLDGLNIWWQARLVEEGVEDMEHLTTANLVDLMLHTRMPVHRMADWIDQAFLFLHVGQHQGPHQDDDQPGGAEHPDRQVLRRHGIRTASDLLDVFRVAETARAEDDGRMLQGLLALLPAEQPTPSRLECIRGILEGEVNLWHIRQWKSGDWLDMRSSIQAPVEHEAAIQSRRRPNGTASEQAVPSAENGRPKPSSESATAATSR